MGGTHGHSVQEPPALWREVPDDHRYRFRLVASMSWCTAEEIRPAYRCLDHGFTVKVNSFVHNIVSG